MTSSEISPEAILEIPSEVRSFSLHSKVLPEIPQKVYEETFPWFPSGVPPAFFFFQEFFRKLHQDSLQRFFQYFYNNCSCKASRNFFKNGFTDLWRHWFRQQIFQGGLGKDETLNFCQKLFQRLLNEYFKDCSSNCSRNYSRETSMICSWDYFERLLSSFSRNCSRNCSLGWFAYSTLNCYKDSLR